MKAERRHELKENSLAKNLENAPAFFQQHGSRILLGLILCLLTYILVSNYFASKAAKLRKSTEDLGSALFALTQLRRIDVRQPPEALAQVRKQYADQASDSIRDLLDHSEDPKFRAEALVARGDLNWLLAIFPPLPGSDTRPTELNVDKSHEELLKNAEDAYTEALKPPLNDPFTAMRAKFGLAYIAEERGDWDAAKQAFTKIIDDPSSSKSDKSVSEAELAGLSKLERKPLIGTPPEVHISSPSPVSTLGPAFGFPSSPSNVSTSGLPSNSIPTTLPSTTPSPATQPTAALSPPAPTLSTPVVAPTTAPATKPAGPSVLPSVELPTTKP